MSKILGLINEGFFKRYMEDDAKDLLEKSIKEQLKKNGYNISSEKASTYIVEAVKSINETRKIHPKYTVEEYIDSHKEELTENEYTSDELFNKFGTTDLDIINAGNEEDVKLKRIDTRKNSIIRGDDDYGYDEYDESLKEETEAKEIFHNDNGIDYDVIERSSSGKNALLNRGKQWIVAWNCPQDSGSWGQGHYFFDEKEARKVWEDKYLNESLKEDYTFGLDDSVKEYIKYITPEDYQVDKIRPNLTFGDVLSNMLSKRGNLLGTYVDSALSQKVLNGLEEIIGTDKFDKVYNNWANSPMRRNRKISRNESLQERVNPRVKRYFEPTYSKRYKVRGYFDSAYRGLSDSFDTDDFDEVRDIAHDYLSDGSYVIVNDYDTGKTIKISPDEYFDNFEGEGIQEYMFESAGCKKDCKNDKKMNTRRISSVKNSREDLPEDFNEKNIEKLGTTECEANKYRSNRVDMYRKFANLLQDEEITEDNINEWALDRVAAFTNRSPERIKAEILGQRYSDYEI